MAVRAHRKRNDVDGPAPQRGEPRDKLRTSLLAWYDAQGRDLPWRIKNPRKRPDPYRVWLSEIMLQQTTVVVAAPYFAKFLKLFPDVRALAQAPREAVLEAWAGLGYYSRARNLHAAAKALAAQIDTGEGFPETEAGWRALPGVGPYTAAAIAAIAFGQATNVVDGNVERVMARLHAVKTPLPQAKPALRERAAALVTDERPGDWAQALMDLGATICTPRNPQCLLCPWREACAASARGDPETYPRRAAKPEKPKRFGVAFRLERGGAIWLERREDKGLYAGMAGLPTTPWRAEVWTRAQALKHAPVKAKWVRLGEVRQVYTHFALTLEVWRAEGPEPQNKIPGGGWWARDASGLGSVFSKAVRLSAI